jgi:hypothetical protein
MSDDDVKALRELAQAVVDGGPDADDAVLYLGDDAPKILALLDERDALIHDIERAQQTATELLAERDTLAALLREAKELLDSVPVYWTEDIESRDDLLPKIDAALGAK